MEYAEAIKALMFTIMTLQELANKTEAEIDQMWQEQRAAFKENKPEALPDAV